MTTRHCCKSVLGLEYNSLRVLQRLVLTGTIADCVYSTFRQLYNSLENKENTIIYLLFCLKDNYIIPEWVGQHSVFDNYAAYHFPENLHNLNDKLNETCMIDNS